ncbi:MAG TPA: biotin carboxylase N-terminal domain-containing protein, partial [Burkholderiaceae bacterium]|nr:biotin carboxylase N-terminal domain-containing protein [Burkholderiaceae bacterium]
MISKILIANRGEIACRVMRTARALGYRTVAVFSDADADAPHVAQADEAVRIGEAPAAESYLNIDALIDAARRTGADAVHPGYGFLSENAAFAQACLDAGLVFIGPPPSAITAMGDKALAKQRMIAAGVPCAPGYLGGEQDDARLTSEALALGFPLLVKAVAGGGGRGMRLVHGQDELVAAIAGARREAQSAFGDGTLMLERLIEGGRHIEIQVFADAHGNAIHLGERDCTAQRRRQKVIEESPSPVVSAAMREAMGRDAVAAALAVGYVGAGTVEFIVDAGLKHYFLEMNTRLQVEHPVTECVTGLDLVEWQLRIASGEPLPLKQHEVQMRGHAIEARLYVEDPYARPTPFAPQTGSIAWWRPEAAAAQPGVRIDHGIAEGVVVTPYYDAMVAKVIAHGRDRDDAIRRLRAALQDAPLLGLRHNAHFLADLVDHADFRGATMTTALIDAWFEREEPIAQRPQPGAEAWCVAAALLAHGEGWRAESVAAYDVELQCEGATQRLRARAGLGGAVQVALADATHEIAVLAHEDGRLRYAFDGVQRRAVALRSEREIQLALGADCYVFTEPSPLAAADAGVDSRRVRAPVAGVVSQIAVQAGDKVAAGQPIACVEAMKMEMWLHAPAAATVAALHVQPGEQVASGALLAELEPV